MTINELIVWMATNTIALVTGAIQTMFYVLGQFWPLLVAVMFVMIAFPGLWRKIKGGFAKLFGR